MPAVNALWETGYGQAILVKAGLLGAAMLIASGNLLRSRPRLIAARERPELGEPAARLLRRLDQRRGRRRRRRRVRRGGAVEPGAAAARVRAPELGARAGRPRPRGSDRHRAGYTLQVLVSPNKAAAPDSFALRITKGGQPVRGANVTLAVQPPRDADARRRSTSSPRPSPGVYSRAAPALVMVGELGADVPGHPEDGLPFTRTDRRPGRRMTEEGT